MLTLVVAVALAMTCETAPTPQATRASLVAFADAFDRAQLAKDASALNRMTSDDLIFIDGSGGRQDKKSFIAGWTAPDDRFEPIKLVDRTVRMLGQDVGIVGAEVRLTGASAGKAFSSRFRFADTFQRTGCRWQAVHIQVTRVG